MASCTAPTLAVSRPGREQADRRPCSARGLQVGSGRCGSGQAGNGAYAAAQLRDAPSRERRRYPHHPGSSGTRQPVEHGALHPGVGRVGPGDEEPARPSDPGPSAGTGAGGEARRHRHPRQSDGPQAHRHPRSHRGRRRQHPVPAALQSRLQSHRDGLLQDHGSPENAEARSVQALWDAIRDAIDAVTPKDARSFSLHAAMNPNETNLL